jgi:hypothetical protein
MTEHGIDPVNESRELEPEAADGVWGRPLDDSPAFTVKCEKCGRLDSTLRATVFTYVLSGIVITLRRAGSSGIFCGSCRRKEGIKWSVLTGVLGWWGIPWGPLYTVQSLVHNARGGIQGAEENAEVLEMAGKELAGRGETPEAIRALEQSVKLRDDPEVSQLLGRLRGY